MSQVCTERCTGAPVSWLRLEQRTMGELPISEVAAIDAHVAACPACSHCADIVAADIVLAPLSVPTQPGRPAPAWPPWFRRPWLAVATVGVVAIAALLLFARVRRNNPAFTVEPTAYPPARVRIKGGELAIDLVREHNGSVATNPLLFDRGDRFKVLATCPASADVDRVIEVTVIQEGDTATPIEPFRTACGNRLALPGAFSLTGRAATTVCIELRSDRACVTIQPSNR